MDYQCLIVDDEEMICQSTCEYFNMFDVKATYVTSYESAISFLEQHTISLLILDINLGQHSGFELCKKIRETTDIPILFVSARTSDDDILTALNIGGDDYITKPYSLNILLAKVRAILKRCDGSRQRDEAKSSLKEVSKGFVLDYNYRQVIIADKKIHLKDMEFKLLSYLAEHKNQVISKDELLVKVWGSEYITEGTLTVHIRRIRLKIEKNPDVPEYVKTVWGVGYVFEEK